MAGRTERPARNVNVFLWVCFSNLFQKVRLREIQKSKAALMSQCVEWQFLDQAGQKVVFDPQTNLMLEEASQNKEHVKLKINGEIHHVDADQRKAHSAVSHKVVQLLRVDKKGESVEGQGLTRRAGNRTPLNCCMTEQLIQVFFGSFTAVLPEHWANMENNLFKQVNLPRDSDEYIQVEQKIRSTGCSLNILKVGGSA